MSENRIAASRSKRSSGCRVTSQAGHEEPARADRRIGRQAGACGTRPIEIGEIRPAQAVPVAIGHAQFEQVELASLRLECFDQIVECGSIAHAGEDQGVVARRQGEKSARPGQTGDFGTQDRWRRGTRLGFRHGTRNVADWRDWRCGGMRCWRRRSSRLLRVGGNLFGAECGASIGRLGAQSMRFGCRRRCRCSLSVASPRFDACRLPDNSRSQFNIAFRLRWGGILHQVVRQLVRCRFWRRRRRRCCRG